MQSAALTHTVGQLGGILAKSKRINSPIGWEVRGSTWGG